MVQQIEYKIWIACSRPHIMAYIKSSLKVDTVVGGGGETLTWRKDGNAIP